MKEYDFKSGFLQEVDQLIHGERAQDYGDAQENFQRIANLWASYKNVDFSVQDVAIMLGLLKISRLAHTPDHRDSWIDLAGYAALGGTLR